MESKLKIENHPDYVKDTNSKAILNTNRSALEDYKKRKEIEENINTINSEISSMKSSIDDIKSLLISLINK